VHRDISIIKSHDAQIALELKFWCELHLSYIWQL